MERVKNAASGNRRCNPGFDELDVRVVNECDHQLRFSLAHLLAVIAYLGFTFSIVRYTGSSMSAVHLSICLMGWLMWRFGRVRLVGLVPSLIGADMVVGFSLSTIQSDEFLGTAGVCFGSIVLLIGLAILFCISARRDRYWRTQLGTAAVGTLLLAAWWFSFPALARAARASDMAANCAATARAVSMIEDVCRQLGRVPSEPELSALLPESLPSVRWGQLSGPIHYRRTSDKAYELTYIDPSEFMGDIVVYNSDTPEKGWYRIPF